MKVLAAHASRYAGHVVPVVAVLLGALGATTAAAQDLPLPAGLGATSQALSRGRLELSSTTTPLFDANTSATQSTRLDMFWLPPRHPSLGPALGLTTLGAPGFAAPGAGGSTGTAVDLGLHWRYDDAWRIDVSAWRRMPSTDNPALVSESSSSYGARFEMRVKSSGRRHFGFDRGLLGFQLEGGAHIGVRRTAGHPMLYYRTSF
jgi:hypothetical protein